MASSVGGQDEPNPALLLDTRACQFLGDYLSCPTRNISSKLVQTRSLDTGLILFCKFLELVSRSFRRDVKKELGLVLGQYECICMKQESFKTRKGELATGFFLPECQVGNLFHQKAKEKISLFCITHEKKLPFSL